MTLVVGSGSTSSPIAEKGPFGMKHGPAQCKIHFDYLGASCIAARSLH